MAEGTAFPQFIVLREDPSNQRVYDDFVRKMGDAGKRASESVGRSLSGVRDTISQALSIPRNEMGSLDLNIQQLREMERESAAVARATREFANAAKQSAIASSEVTRARTEEIRAAFELARAEEANVRQIQNKIRVYDQVQTELNQTASATDILIGKNNELIRSMQQVAREANVADSSQRNVNTLTAPGLDPFRAATKNGATFSALADMLAQDEAAQKLRNDLDLLRRAEVSAVESATMLAAAHRGTALEIGHSAKSARDSAAVFEAMYREQEQAARSMDELRRAHVGAYEGAKILESTYRGTALATDAMSKSARESAMVFEEAARAQAQNAAGAQNLREALDPALRVQRQFDQELARADTLLENGAISQREYAAAVLLARNNLQSAWGALTQNADQTTKAVGRGTDAWGIHAQSMRGTRQAMVQTGQQLQDVAISLYGGQRATTVFAQQIPQLMFALTSLEGSANKTASKIGSFATVMSGPLSIAVVGVSAVVGLLVDKFLLSGDAADKSGSAMDKLSNKLDLSKNSYEALIAVVNEYNKTQSDSIALSYEAAVAAETKAKALIAEAKAQIISIEAAPHYAGQELGGRQTALAVSDSLQKRITELEAGIGTARMTQANELSKRGSDPRYALEIGFREKRAKMEAEYQALADKGLLTSQKAAEYESKRTKSINDQTAALKAYDDAKRESNKKAPGFRGDMVDFGSPVHGGSITSGYGIRTAPTKGASTNHLGIDYGVKSGTPIYATQDGVVIYAGTAGGYGNQVRLNHGAGTETRYSHLSKFAVGDKQAVNKGDVIGYSGQTGVATGPHLHYEVLVNGKKVDPSKGRFPMDSSKVAEEAKKAADVLNQFGERSAEKISRINEAFDEQPRLIDRANQATRELDKTISELQEQKPIGWEQMVSDAQKAKGTIEDSLLRPMRELTDESNKRMEIERLITAGKEDEAQALQIIYGLEKSIGPLRSSQKQDILEQVKNERLVTEELRRRQEITNLYLDATRSVKQELASIFSGTGSFKNLSQIFKNLQGQVIVEKLFGSAFRDFDKWVKGESGLSASVDYFTTETTSAGDAAMNFAGAVNDAASRLRAPAIAGARSSIGAGAAGIASLFGAANDNPNGDIVVEGRKVGNTVMSLSPERYFSELTKTIVGPALDGLDAIFGTKFFAKMSGAFSGAMNGYLTGGTTGGILGGLEGLLGSDSKIGKALGKGVSGAQTGTMVSGIGNAFGIKLSTSGSQIGGAIGSLLPIPGGEIIGAIAGGMIGKFFEQNKVSIPGLLIGGLLAGIPGALLGGVLFSKAKYGAASISNGNVSLTGNNDKYKEGAGTAAGSINDSLQAIANKLGASLGNYAVSIGLTKGNWNVNPGTVNGKIGTKWQSNTIDFKKDQEGAIRWAIMNAIQDGAIAGLRASSQVLLQKGKDIEAQVEKVLRFEDVFKTLRSIKDPVGAAIADLDKWAADMKALFAEAGASAEEYAQLEELYGIKRAEAIKQASEAMTASLRSLLDDLTVGNDALSLRERQGAALGKYDPLKARVAAGDTTAYNDFADAARALLDIERQMFGSQSGYFDRLAEVTGISRAALSSQDALINGSTGSASPFAANDNVVGALGTQTGLLQGSLNALIAGFNATNLNLGTLIQLNMGGSGSFQVDSPLVANY